MKTVVLRAHYDGEEICLDEPYEFQPNTKLLVVIAPEESVEEERQTWLAASQVWLARAYGENEPDYSDSVLPKGSQAE